MSTEHLSAMQNYDISILLLITKDCRHCVSAKLFASITN